MGIIGPLPGNGGYVVALSVQCWTPIENEGGGSNGTRIGMSNGAFVETTMQPEEFAKAFRRVLANEAVAS